MHFDGDDAVALAGLAPPAFHVEREAARPESAGPRVGHHREQIADEREQPGIGRRVRARRSSDRRLIDLDDLVDELDAVDAIVGAGLVAGAIERFRQRLVQDVVDERRLAGSAHAGDRREEAERQADVDVLQVVRARAADDNFALQRRPAASRDRDRSRTGQIQARERRSRNLSGCRTRFPTPFPRHRLHQVTGRALEDHVPAVLAGAGAEIDHVVGGSDRLLVVLDDDHGVAEVAQPRQRRRAACGCRAGGGRSTARRARTARR